MTVTFTGGTLLADNAAITVMGGVTATVDGNVHPRPGITISFLAWADALTIQFYQRSRLTGGTLSSYAYASSSTGEGTRQYIENLLNFAWYVDSTSSTIPYYDEGGGHVFKDLKYTMYDSPSMNELPSNDDWERFDAYTFCISDKAPIGMVAYSIRRQGTSAAVFKAAITGGSDRAFSGWITWGRDQLAQRKYNPIYLTEPAINPAPPKSK